MLAEIATIWIFRCSKNNFTTMGHADNEWDGGMMLLPHHLHTRDILTADTCGLTKPTPMETLMSVPAKTHSLVIIEDNAVPTDNLALLSPVTPAGKIIAHCRSRVYTRLAVD